MSPDVAVVADVLNKRRAEDDRLDPDAAGRALVTALDGGLSTDGLYLREDRELGLPGAMPFTRGRVVRDGTLPWDVRQLHDDPDAARSRAAVLDDLERRAEGQVARISAVHATVAAAVL